MSFLEKLRQKPEKTKRKILWIVVLSVGLFLVFSWLLYLKYYFSIINFNNFSKPNIGREDFIRTKQNIIELKNKLEKEVRNIQKNSKDLENKDNF